MGGRLHISNPLLKLPSTGPRRKIRYSTASFGIYHSHKKLRDTGPAIFSWPYLTIGTTLVALAAQQCRVPREFALACIRHLIHSDFQKHRCEALQRPFSPVQNSTQEATAGRERRIYITEFGVRVKSSSRSPSTFSKARW